jgi:predicted RNase H-like HicB family nuclease
MTEYDVYRSFPDGLSAAELDGAVSACGETIEEMRAEGADVSYLGTEVLMDDSETIVGTMCCFDGESSAQIEELNERAGVPFVETYRRGSPIAGEREKRAA